jgi:hypothetical protein
MQTPVSQAADDVAAAICAGRWFSTHSSPMGHSTRKQRRLLLIALLTAAAAAAAATATARHCRTRLLQPCCRVADEGAISAAQKESSTAGAASAVVSSRQLQLLSSDVCSPL